MYINFYKSKNWKIVKDRRLRIDSYLCQCCKRKGKSTTSTQVHHIKPLEWCIDNEKAMCYSQKNLISLCVSCHNAMHNRKNGTLTSEGNNLVKRIFGSPPP